MTTLPKADFDTPWKDILENFFPQFMEFFFPLISTAIDWKQPFEFLDTELRKLTPEDASHAMCVDKLVKVTLLGDVEVRLLIHIEIQSQYDIHFPLRMYIYNYRVFDSEKKPVLSLAILSDENTSWRPQKFTQGIFGCETSMKFPIVKLLDFENRIDELESTMNPFGIITLAHLTALRTKKDINLRVNTKLALIRKLYKKGFKKEDVRHLFIFIDWVISLPKAVEIEYYHQLQSIKGEQNMPYVSNFERHYTELGFQQGLQKGQEEGREEGREEGILKGEIAVLLRQLQLKFKILPESYKNHLINANSELLLKWSERVLSSHTLEEIFE